MGFSIISQQTTALQWVNTIKKDKQDRSKKSPKAKKSPQPLPFLPLLSKLFSQMFCVCSPQEIVHHWRSWAPPDWVLHVLSQSQHQENSGRGDVSERHPGRADQCHKYGDLALEHREDFLQHLHPLPQQQGYGRQDLWGTLQEGEAGAEPLSQIICQVSVIFITRPFLLYLHPLKCMEFDTQKWERVVVFY